MNGSLCIFFNLLIKIQILREGRCKKKVSTHSQNKFTYINSVYCIMYNINSVNKVSIVLNHLFRDLIVSGPPPQYPRSQRQFQSPSRSAGTSEPSLYQTQISS